MVLPMTTATTPSGVETGLRRFAERFNKPIVIYLKFENYLTVEEVKRLVEDGIVCAIKYAVVRKDPAVDGFLTELCAAVDHRYIISGIGERPAVVHLRDFGIASFTSGSVCVAPRQSTALLRALLIKVTCQGQNRPHVRDFGKRHRVMQNANRIDGISEVLER